MGIEDDILMRLAILEKQVALISWILKGGIAVVLVAVLTATLRRTFSE